MYQTAKKLIKGEAFATHIGVEIVSCRKDWAHLRLPYASFLGDERVNGGAIASLIDLAATCAFWSHPEVNDGSKGATIGFNINFIKLVKKGDIFAIGVVKRRGSNICVGTAEVESALGEKIALATITYKLNN